MKEAGENFEREGNKILMDHLRPLIHERNGQNRVQSGLDLLRVRRLLSLGIAVGYAEGFQLLRDGPAPRPPPRTRSPSRVPRAASQSYAGGLRREYATTAAHRRVRDRQAASTSALSPSSSQDVQDNNVSPPPSESASDGDDFSFDSYYSDEE